MKAWDAFFPDVLPELPSAPDVMVAHWLRNAAIEFYKRSCSMIVDLDPVDAEAGQSRHDLFLPNGTALHDVIEARFNGRRLTPAGVAHLDDTSPDVLPPPGTPERYTVQDQVALLLSPAPAVAASEAITVKAVLVPSATASGVDDVFFARHRVAIAKGCKALMMAMSDKPWSSLQASRYRGEFDADITDAMVNASRGHTRAVPRFSGRFC